MSVPASQLEGTAAPPPRAPRRRWLRRLAWLAGTFVALVLLLHTPPARRLVAGLLVRLASAALGEAVSLERLDYRLWAGEVRLEGVHASSPRFDLDCARAEARWGPFDGLRVRLIEPRIVVTLAPGGSAAPRPRSPSQPWALVNRLAVLELEQGGLELRDSETRPWLQLRAVGLRLDQTAGLPRAALSVGEAGVGWPGGGIRLEPVRAEATLELQPESGALRLRSARLQVADGVLEGEGELTQLDPIAARVDATARLGSGLIRSLAPQLEIEGRLDAQLSFATDAAGGRGTLAAAAGELRVFEVGPWTGSVHGRLEGRKLILDLAELAGYGGRVAAGGEVFLWDGRSELQLSADGLEVAALAATFAGTPPPVASRADASLRVAIDSWRPETFEGRGEVALRSASGKGWPVAGTVSVSLTGQELRFAADALRAHEAVASVVGSLSFEKDLDLHYTLHLPDLAHAPALLAVADIADLPEVTLGGVFEAEGTVSGRLPDWHIHHASRSHGASVEGLDFDSRAVLRIDRQGITIESFVARGPDAVAEARGFVPLAPQGTWQVTGRLDDLRLTDALVGHGVGLSVGARGSFRVTGAAADPRLDFELQARADAADTDAVPKGGEPEPAAEPSSPAPQAARLQLAGSLTRRGVVIDSAAADLGGGQLEAAGSWVFADGGLEARLRLADVALERLPWRPAGLEPVSGVLSADAEISGAVGAPVGQAHVAVERAALRGAALPDARLDASTDGHELTLDGRLGEAQLLTGRLPLADPWPLHVELELATLPFQRVVAAWPDLAKAGLSLALAGRARLDVPLRTPDDLRYEASVESVEARVARSWHSGPFSLRGDRRGLAIEGLEAVSGESRLHVAGTLGLAEPSLAPLRVEGDFPLAELAVFLGAADLAGRAELSLELGGSLAEPRLEGRVGVSDARGTVDGLPFDDGQIDGRFEEGVLTLTRATVRVAGGEASASGSLPIGPRARGHQQLDFALRGVDLGVLAPRGEDDVALSAVVDLEGRVAAAQPGLASLAAEGRLTRLAVAAGSERLALEAPVEWSFRAACLEHGPLRLRGPQSELAVALQLDASHDAAAFAVAARGEADLALLNAFLVGTATLSGPLRLDGHVERDASGWRAAGEASTSGAGVVVRTPPLAIKNVQGRFRADGQRIELLDWSGSVGDGRLEAGGQIGLTSSGLDVDLAVRAQQVPLEYPEGLRSRSSGEVRLLGRDGRFRLAGDVVVHRAVYERETDTANQSLDRVGAELEALDARGSPLEKVQLAVRVRLEDGLRVSNSQASLVVDGGLNLGGDLLTPEVSGSLTLREGGSVRLSRAQLRLQSGRIELRGYPARPPELDVRGSTQVTGVLIDASLSGPLDDVRMNLTSPNRSDLGQGDLATLILTGRTASAAASQSGAIVAEEMAAALGEALDRKLGGAVFIDVSRDESLIVEDTNPSQRFNIGIPIGQRTYVIYSQALDRSALRWIVDYRPGGEFRVRLISDEDGSEAAELSHRFNLNLWSRKRRPRPPRESPSRIRRIAFEGALPGEEAELGRRAKLKPGQKYDYFRGEDAARRVRDFLREHGYRAALVEAHDEEVAPGQEDVTLRIERGPQVALEWRGDDPGRRRRKHAESAFDPYLPLSETAARLAGQLRRELRAEGYYSAQVKAEVSEAEGEATVVLDVQRGVRGKGVDLRFEGNATVSSARLAEALPPTRSAEFFALLERSGHGRLARRLRVPYANEGFLSARAGPPREALDPATGRLAVTVPIEEGDRASVVALELPEVATVPRAGEPPALRTKPGDPFRLDAYVDDRATLASWLRGQGYPEARVVGILEPVEEGMIVRFGADPGERPTIGEVRLAREGRTRRAVVDEALTLGPGDPVTPAALNESRENLGDTQAFRSIDLRLEPGSPAETRDLVVDLAERDDLTVEYSVRYTTAGSGQVGGAPSSSTAGVQFGGAIQAVNPFGWAHRYRIYGLIGNERTLLGANFDAATFFGRRWRTQLFLFDDQDRVETISRLGQRITGATFQQTQRWRSGIDRGRWHDRLRMQWGYTFKHIRYTDLDTGATLEGDRAGLIHSLIGDTRDSLTDPQRGRFWSLGSELALQALGSEVEYFKTFGQLSVYLPLGEHVVWAQGYRLGVVPGDDPLLLLESRFQAGGSTSVRGFPENGLGPQTAEGVALGGQAVAIFNQELRFPIWKQLHGGVFYDAGNVFALARDLDLGALRQSAGVGLRWMFPFGPVRLDWARVLDPKPGEQRSRWIFGIGHAF